MKIFIIKQIQRKLMTKIFLKLKNPYFWPIFGPLPTFLEAKSVFPKNLGSTT